MLPPESNRMSENSAFIDAAGIAVYTGRSIDTVRYWERIGQLPPSAKVGRRRVWKRDVITAHFDGMFAVQSA